MVLCLSFFLSFLTFVDGGSRVKTLVVSEPDVTTLPCSRDVLECSRIKSTAFIFIYKEKTFVRYHTLAVDRLDRRSHHSFIPWFTMNRSTSSSIHDEIRLFPQWALRLRMQPHLQTHARITHAGIVRLVFPTRRCHNTRGVVRPHAFFADAGGV